MSNPDGIADARAERGAKTGRSRDERLDEALEGTFPASDPFDLSHAKEVGEARLPCRTSTAAPAHAGYFNPQETIALLNELLQGERAGARGLLEIGGEGADPASSLLHAIGLDEARFCAMLTRHITLLGGTPSRKTGAFYGKLLALASRRERIALLDRGQASVVRKLAMVLPRIDDYTLHRDLKEMLETHERNIRLGLQLH